MLNALCCLVVGLGLGLGLDLAILVFRLSVVMHTTFRCHCNSPDWGMRNVTRSCSEKKHNKSENKIIEYANQYGSVLVFVKQKRFL